MTAKKQESKFEQKWKNDQYVYFEKAWKEKWSKLYPQEDSLLQRILNLKYDKFADINIAFGKLDMVLKICHFLQKLEKEDKDDIDKIVITTLVSCAEAVYRLIKPNEYIYDNLVKGFFGTVEDEIEHKIRGHIGNMPYRKTFGAVEVLYLIRNDYIHNGNCTGKFFTNDNTPLFDKFYYREESEPKEYRLVEADSECHLSQQEFVDIFKKAFIEVIKKYLEKSSS